MKKRNIIIKFILPLNIMFFLGSSCTDEVENLQPFINGNPATFFNSVSAFQNGLDGGYLQLRNYYADSGSGYQGLPDILSDNVVQAFTGRLSNDVYYDFRYVPSTNGFINRTFSEAYEAVNVANLVIGQIDNLPDAEPQKNNILAQALAIRAMAHFDLVRLYAQIPTQSDGANASPGIAYIQVENEDIADPLDQPERETVQSNYNDIAADLERAAGLIDAENGEGRFDRDGVYGLLSRVYLYMGRWEDAVNAADQVSVALAAGDELIGMYEDANEAGIVLELSIDTGTETGTNTLGNNVGVLYSQSSPDAVIVEYAIEFDLWNSIDEATDARADAMQFVAVDGDGNSYNGISKFFGETGQNNGRVDIKAIRAAEVILNKAEAEFELGREADALATLDELRAVRFDPFVAGTETGQALEDAIQFNRRVELAFEGHRLFDLKRRREGVVRSNNGDLIDGTGTPADALTLPAGDFRFQLPIPINETNANPNFGQNPGY